MSLRCSLIGHRYGDPVTEEKTEESNGRTALAEIRREECVRCGHTKKKRMRTRIVNDDSELPDEGQTTESSDDNQQQKYPDKPSSSTPSSLTSSPSTKRTGDGNPAAVARDDSADGGVFLQSEGNQTEEVTGFDDTPDEIRNEDERQSDEDEGVVMLKGKKGSEPPQEEFTVCCESCDFERVERGSARRDGDLCPECGGWLEVVEES